MNKMLKVVIATVFLTALAGCHTVSGAGQDLSAGGHAITKAANS